MQIHDSEKITVIHLQINTSLYNTNMLYNHFNVIYEN